jgi:antitoxin (DNA-binding transcriptional repressor) of toxin-antitoxin stability system
VKKARIAVAKNNLSRLIDDVKRGESILILDRDTPVARLEPVATDPGSASAWMADLVRSGIVAPPRKPLDAAAFLARPLPAVRAGASGVGNLLEEREESR